MDLSQVLLSMMAIGFRYSILVTGCSTHDIRSRELDNSDIRPPLLVVGLERFYQPGEKTAKLSSRHERVGFSKPVPKKYEELSDNNQLLSRLMSGSSPHKAAIAKV